MSIPAPPRRRFSKMHGAGNDFIVLDLRDGAPPPTPAEARLRLAALSGTGAVVAYRDAGVTRGPEWADEPTKITEFLAFADLRQATARTAGGVISFPAQLSAGEYGVHLLWFGAAAERAPEIEVELVAPGAEPRVVRVDHRRERDHHRQGAVRPCRIFRRGDCRPVR